MSEPVADTFGHSCPPKIELLTHPFIVALHGMGRDSDGAVHGTRPHLGCKGAQCGPHRGG
jgi:hypothetical protein